MDFFNVAIEAVKGVLMMMRPADFVDILIVAFVAYKTARLVRETRAEQLIKGLVVLVVVTQLSHWLQFNTINYILRNTMQVGVVALLVVFQPELRRALEKVGRSNLGNILFSSQNQNIDSTVSEIVKAVDVFAKDRTGALIVIERETRIGDIITTGTELDAIISAELLINIFTVKTPLHDGAVIVRDGKIKAAACLLPLTQNNSLSRELGTRHRAALGISEVSDSVVVVVSEETGKISIALDGGMTRNLTVDSLQKALYKTLAPDTAEKRTGDIRAWKERLKWSKK